MKRLVIYICWILACKTLVAQGYQDSIRGMNMDAVYNRPFLTDDDALVQVGGYIEANTNYSGSDGITEGLSFQIPRLTLFISSSIQSRIKFLTELEIEEGGETIAIEFASVDVEFHPLVNLRGGVMMNPIGAFNQNHDGPKWEFIDRPIASTTIIPSTWSNVGFGLYGKTARNNMTLAYEFYATNGFDPSIIENSENRTWLPAAKSNFGRFEESFNGEPLFTAKIAARHLKIAEIGLSWMGGVYNDYRLDGIVVDNKRRVDLLALDFNSTIGPTNTTLVGEYVWAWIDVPTTYSQNFGTGQEGGFIDIIQPIWRKEVFNWPAATINLALRLEYTDYNIGEFVETGDNIFDHRTSIVPAISFRPSAITVFRFNFRTDHERDLLGNPSVKTLSYQFGFSSYF